jgi:hypothetical protein
MATKRRDYVITTHLRERFVQRTNKKYNHLQDCRMPKCEQCRSLQKEIRSEVIYGKKEIDELIYSRLDVSDENRHYLNNSGFMEWYYNKYGYDKRFEFLNDGEILFVVVYDEGQKVIVTCVSAKTHLAGKTQVKFNRIKKKEEKVAV